jgi:hypothetical protein
LETKICKECGLEKDIVVKRTKEWRENNPDKHKIMADRGSKKYRSIHPFRPLITSCIIRSKKNNIPYDSFKDLCDYLEPIYNFGECTKCHCKLESGNGKNAPNLNSPSIDRLVPEKGYVVGNVTVLCMNCNRKKQDNTYEDFISWVKWYEDQLNLSNNNQTKVK